MSKSGGGLDEVTWSGSIEDCGNSSNFNMAATVHAVGDESDYDHIAYKGYNIWRFQMHFTDRPGDTLSDPCKDPGGAYDPEPVSFEWNINTEHDSDPKELSFSEERPEDGVKDDDYAEWEVILDFIDSLSGNVYLSLGSTVMKYLIGSNGVSFDSNGGYSNWYWDVPLKGGFDDLPHEHKSDRAKVAEVKCKVHNQFKEGTHHVDCNQSFTFEYLSNNPADCGCNPVSMWKTTSTTKLLQPEYTVGDP
ncbi:hypothetical protein [Haloferax larsenii]|uniref:Uncharacterized protein n=1 Tax=Haloferax larsenii TaxID=302484 RepID=A0A1H7UUM4_HALLR|nr:hypothetical protein [Haloferax larsenii]SEM00157.1 hypothetical protein SAMN04488691_11427 [Haloferax larsenii]